MKFAIATVAFWEALGYDTANWRKSNDGNQAITELKYAEILGVNLAENPKVKIYFGDNPELIRLLDSGAWHRDGTNGPFDSYNLLEQLAEVDTRLTTAVADVLDSEADREYAESIREIAHGQQTETASADHLTASTDHTTALADHGTAGTDHTTASSDHGVALTDTGRALADHNTAVSDHGTASSDSTRAGTDHTTAVADHGIAQADHGIAQADHTTAGADHTTALADHASYEGLLTDGVLTTNIENTLNNLETTYAPRLLSAEQQLAEKTTEITKSAKRDLSLSTIKRDIPLVSFVDDDGNPAVLTKLRPLAEMYGVPFTICMPSDFIMNGNGLSVAQLKDLQDSNGFEIASHGKTHTPINTSMPNEQQEVEVYESWRQMRELGLNVETIVYPYGQSTPYAREIVSRYYKAGVSTDTRLNPTPLLTYRLGRLQFPTTGWTLSNYTAKVDEAIANKSWLIFMLHCGQAEHDAATQTILEQLIQYVQSVNVDIVNITDGIDISGNVIDINEQSIYYAKNGKNNIRDYYFEPIDNSNNNASHNGSHLPADFTDNKATINILTTSADTATMPNGQRGALLTQKGNQASSVASQFYLTTRGLFYRSGSGTAWHDVFNRVFAGIPVAFTLDFGTIPAGTVVTKDYQIQNMFAGHFIELTNKTNLHRNLMLSKHISGAWTLSINIFNPTASPIIVGEVGFDVLWMKPAT